MSETPKLRVANMWKIVLRSTDEVLANGFASLADADNWHDNWLDSLPGAEDDDFFSVDFIKY